MNTETVISCKITAITEKMSIKWTGFTAGDNFVPTPGSYDSSTNSQTGTLTVKSAAVTTDETYTCSISSLQYSNSDVTTFEVNLYVYSE